MMLINNHYPVDNLSRTAYVSVVHKTRICVVPKDYNELTSLSRN